jgi:hypothetical protein
LKDIVESQFESDAALTDAIAKFDKRKAQAVCNPRIVEDALDYAV